jgi:hypothetical protein
MKVYNLSKTKWGIKKGFMHREFNVLPSVELHWCNGGNWKKYRYVNIKWLMWMLQINLL